MKLVKRFAAVLSAALVGSVLSVIPAQATVPTIALSINEVAVTTAASSATPATVSVPADNSVNAVDAVKFDLTGLAAGSIINASAVNASLVSALATETVPVTASAGASTWSINTGTGTTVSFFAFTKTTAVGFVTITVGANAYTYYLKGTAGPAYNLAFDPVTTGNTSSSVKVVAKVTDVFGNPVAGVTPVASAVNLTVDAIAATAADGTTDVTLRFPAAAGRAAVSLSITAADVTGFVPATKTKTAFIDIADLAVLLAAEKAARAADKAAADKALADAKTAADAAAVKAAADLVIANAEIAKLKAEAVTAKAAADKALADAIASATAAKAASDKAIADLTAQVTALTKAVADIKKAYNAMAKKYKFKTIK